MFLRHKIRRKDGKAATGCAASASLMGRFEARWLTAEKKPAGACQSFRPMDRARA
jgi:hypothetical protein